MTLHFSNQTAMKIVALLTKKKKEEVGTKSTLKENDNFDVEHTRTV